MPNIWLVLSTCFSRADSIKFGGFLQKVVVACLHSSAHTVQCLSHVLCPADFQYSAERKMKSLIHNWTKKSKGKGKGSAGGSDQGRGETSSESARSGQEKPSNDSTPTQIYPGMGAKDFGKVTTHLNALPCMLESSYLIAQQTLNLLQACN